MRVDKIVLRAFLSTLAAIGVLLVFMCSALCIVFPSTMMEMTYDLGMEAASIHFAERAYKESDDICYIAYATEVAIEQEKESKIVACGEKFIEDKSFNAFCEEKGEAYEQFIYGQVCVSKYRRGEKEQALALAAQSVDAGRFPQNNALVVLLVASFEGQDAETVAKIREKLATLEAVGTEKEYLDKAIEASK